MNFATLFKLFGGKKMNRVELAVLRVSMLLAALDGDITKDELAEFEQLAKGCEAYSKEEVDKAFADSLRSAGYLMLLARVADKQTLLDAFLVEAECVFPVIANLGPEVVEKSAQAWKNMANADGYFSEIEREAIEGIERMLALRNQAQVQSIANGMVGIRM